MEIVSDLESAFRFLRPLCVLVSQNHDIKSVTDLSQVLAGNTINEDFLQELQEYVAFPLRLILNQFALKDENLCIATLRCLRALLSKTSVVKPEICIDLFTTILNILSPLSKADRAISEDVKEAGVEAVGSLIRTCSFRCNCALYREALPLVGALISVLIKCAEKEKLLKLQLSALNCLHVLLDHRRDGELRRLLELTSSGFLPAVSISLHKILVNPKQHSKVLVTALKCLRTMVIAALPDEPSCQNPSDIPSIDERARTLLVEKTDNWYADTSKKLDIVIRDVCQSCTGHDSWTVRQEMVEWSFNLLYYCHKNLAASKSALLDALVSHAGDDYSQVSSRCQKLLQSCQEKLDGVKELLEERIYELSIKLPRLLDTNDEKQSLGQLRLFSGYLRSLSTQIPCLLRSHSHLERISLALLQTLELDCNGIHILDTTSTAAGSDAIEKGVDNSRFPLLQRCYAYFTDDKIWIQIQLCIHCFCQHGDLYALIDHFICLHQSGCQHKIQSVIVLNEVIKYHVRSNTTASSNPAVQPNTSGQSGAVVVSAELVNCCKTVLEVYTNTYRDVAYSDNDRSESIKQRNERTQLLCLTLEGIVYIHQVTGEDYPELLLHSLYPLLESCAHDSVLVSQTAVSGLAVISKAFKYSGISELIEKHCNYLCNALSLHIRRLHRHPTCPQVLHSVIKYSQKTILPYIEQIVLEVLYSLDSNYIDKALSLLRVPQVLLQQMCKWYSHSNNRENPDLHNSKESDQLGDDLLEDNGKIDQSTTESLGHDSNADDSNHKCDHTQSLSEDDQRPGKTDQVLQRCEKVREIVEFVMEYYKTKKVVEDLELSSDDDISEPITNGNAEDEVNLLEEQEKETQEKKKTPLHISLAKQILDRCRHLVSHSHPKIRLLTVEMIADGCTVLSEVENELLPAVHDVWSGLSKRFLDTEPLVVLKALQCLQRLGDLSKDFIRARVTKDVLPSLCQILNSKSANSVLTGKAYRHTLEYKLQATILKSIGSLCKDLKVVYPVLETVVKSCLVYLSLKQPLPLQKLAILALNEISSEEPDMVWYLVSRQAAGAEFTENASTILCSLNLNNVTRT